MPKICHRGNISNSTYAGRFSSLPNTSSHKPSTLFEWNWDLGSGYFTTLETVFGAFIVCLRIHNIINIKCGLI